MKIRHWSFQNGSGLHRVAESMAAAETALGLDSQFVNGDPVASASWEETLDADIHVSHSHVPEQLRSKFTKPLRLVFVGHGTPEHVFEEAIHAGVGNHYGHADGLMLLQYQLQNADAIVTFWPRHQAIYQLLSDKRTKVDCIPLGVDKAYWAGGVSRGKYAGQPSVWTGENQHRIKWILDLLFAWKSVYTALNEACIHAPYLPADMHRWLFPIANRTGFSYKAHMSPRMHSHEELRNVFKSIDFFIGLVRYGDFNRLSHEANAAGVPTISYAGNEYADYWITEGDHRVIAKELVAILKGDTPKRTKTAVPDVSDMAVAMQSIYERIAA